MRLLSLRPGGLRSQLAPRTYGKGMAMQDNDHGLDARTFLETIAGQRCPCGHATQQHEDPDPEWRVGTLRQVTGACSECPCKGEIA